jgi:hypothetical protein
MAGVTTVRADEEVELSADMFFSWDGFGADATSVAAANVDFNIGSELGAGAMVCGTSTVDYLIYADLTGSTKMLIEGTAGMQLRVLMNRQESNSGPLVERNPVIGEDGKAELDLSDLPYVHLNAIKTGWGSPAGTITSIMLEGTVKPVTGYLDLISNGDAEGDDLSSFPLALHADQNDDGKAAFFPEVVEGEGVDGSKAFKIVSDNDAPQTWTTQQFIKFDEPLREGDKWRLSMDIRAARPQQITSSAQGAPRSWHGGFVDGFDDGFQFGHRHRAARRHEGAGDDYAVRRRLDAVALHPFRQVLFFHTVQR